VGTSLKAKTKIFYQVGQETADLLNLRTKNWKAV